MKAALPSITNNDAVAFLLFVSTVHEYLPFIGNGLVCPNVKTFVLDVCSIYVCLGLIFSINTLRSIFNEEPVSMSALNRGSYMSESCFIEFIKRVGENR